MSNEERQRTLRRAGSEPAEAETQEGARESRERMRREEAAAEKEQRREGDQPTPLPEVPGEPPRPRR